MVLLGLVGKYEKANYEPYTKGHFADINSRIAQVDKVIDRLVSEYEGAISLLCTIPGIDRRLAITIISEIGTDMSQFGSSKRLCNWAGLSPGRNQSAGKKKSVKIFCDVLNG